jgi:hypothetical protein
MFFTGRNNLRAIMPPRVVSRRIGHRRLAPRRSQMRRVLLAFAMTVGMVTAALAADVTGKWVQ